jgi:hypothetical protein
MGTSGRRGLLSGGVPPVSDGSALNFHCINTTGWSLFSQGNSVASLVGGTYFRGYSGAATDPANAAVFIKNSFFTPPSGISVINLPIEIDTLENIAEATGRVNFEITTVDASKKFFMRIYNDSLVVTDSSDTEQTFYVGPPPYGSQFTIRIKVNVTSQLCEIWYGDNRKLRGVDCGATTANSGRFVFSVQNTKAVDYTPITADLDEIIIGAET